MKLLTTTTKKVFSHEYGWLNEVKYKVLGVTIMTERSFADDIPQTDKEVADIEDMALYLEWRDKCKLPFIANEKFEEILHTKFTNHDNFHR